MSRITLQSTLVLTMLSASGCMYQQPMYQPGYGQSGYGQPMYAPGGYAQPGTLVVPQSNAPAYSPGSTYDSNIKSDDFDAPGSSTQDPRFFGADGGVPPGRDPDNSEPFTRDLTP